MANRYQKPELYFLIFCIVVSCILFSTIFYVFLGSFVFASIFAASLIPLHRKLVSKFKVSEKLSAILLVLLLGVVIVYPLNFILTNSYEEVLGIINSLNTNNPILLPSDTANISLSSKLYQLIVKVSGYEIPRHVFDERWHNYTQTLADQMLSYLNYLISHTATFLFDFIIFLLTTFVILTKGTSIKKRFFKLSLLPERDEEYIVRKFENLNRVLLLGNTIGGSLQAIIGFIIMSFMGLEKVLFWSLLILLCSFIPVLGSALVFLPMSIYLWFMGKKFLAVCLFSLMSITYLGVENWFKPRFIGGRIQMHSLVVLFSMLGGVNFFGIPGIFYGPLITTLFLSLMDLYHQQAAID